MNNTTKLLAALVVLALVFVALPSANAQSEADSFGSKVQAGDVDFVPRFTAATTTGNFLVIEYDPSQSTTGDEEYFLRLRAKTHSGAGAADQLQVADVNLRTGEVLAQGSEALNYAADKLSDASTAVFVGEATIDGETYVYLTFDADTDIERHDIRVTGAEAEGQSYASGSRVGINDLDRGFGYDAAPVALTAGRLSFFDANEAENLDHDFDEGDSLYYQLGGQTDFARVDDVRIVSPNFEFGSRVDVGDNDFVAQYTLLGDAVRSGFDVIRYDPDTQVGGDEEYFLRTEENQFTGTQLQAGDIHLGSGRVLAEGDAELSYSQADLDATVTVGILTANGDDPVDPEVYYYLDADNSNSLNRYDVRLTDIEVSGGQSYSAGTKVGSQDDDVLRGGVTDRGDLTAADIGWFDLDSDDRIDPGEDYLLLRQNLADFTTGTFAFANIDDFRLHHPKGVGTLVEINDNDFLPTFSPATTDNGLQQFALLLYDPEGEYTALGGAGANGNEKVFLRLRSDTQTQGTIQAGDIDLTTGEVLQSGSSSQALGAPSDQVTDVTGTLELLQVTIDGEEYYYLDMDDSGTITRYDVRLTDVSVDDNNWDAGSYVGLNDENNVGGAPVVMTLVGTNAAAVTAGNVALAWFDADANDRWSAGVDALYLFPGSRGDNIAAIGDFSQYTSLDDVRLVGLVQIGERPGTSPTTTQTGTQTQTGTDTQTGTETETGTQTQTGTETQTETETQTGTETETGTTPPSPTDTDTTTPGTDTTTSPTGDGDDTPGFGVFALIAALGAALVLVRRKL